MEVIYKGLQLKTENCKYWEVREGSINSIRENEATSTLILTYSSGSSALSVSKSLGIPLIGRGEELEETHGPKKFHKTTVCLNGFLLEKLTTDSHIFQIVIVRDSESRVIQSYGRTILVVNFNDATNQDFIKFLFFSGGLLYLRPAGKLPDCYTIKNFSKFLISDTNLNLTSTDDSIFTLRRRYDDYVIREIDYQDQFIIELRKILDDYGVELVRVNKESTLTKPNYITYQISQTPSLYGRAWTRDPQDKLLNHTLAIDFTFHSTDMVMYHDFKNKFSNVNLVSNFTEFKTSDKYGNRWTAAVRWGQITEDFNHIYQPDDNSNFAYQCQFRCEIFFYEALDTRYNFLKEILLELDHEDVDGEVVGKEEKSIK